MSRASSTFIRDFAKKAIENQYTASGKPRLNTGIDAPNMIEPLEQLEEIYSNSRAWVNEKFDMLNDIDRAQWESTKELYALGRRNFLKYCKAITALAVTNTVIGTIGLIIAIRGYAK